MTAGGCQVAGMASGGAGCEHYLEDFAVGQTFSSGRLRIEEERMLAFAAEFDPQPFHLDEAAARQSFFGELTASGWYTAFQRRAGLVVVVGWSLLARLVRG